MKSLFLLVPSLLISSVLLVGCGTMSSPATEAGVAAYRRGHYDVALFALESRADAGDREAQFYLGLMYVDDIWAVQQHGQTSDKRRAKGTDFLEKAADQGHLGAQLRLGDEYLRRETYQDAEKWYLAAASQDPENKEANFGLGQVYRKIRKIEEARAYYQKAADKQHLDAMFWLSYINDDEVMLQKAADKGHVRSLLNIGRMKYIEARQHSRDGNTRAYSRTLKDAEHYLRQIAQKNSMAQAQLSTLLEHKEKEKHPGVKKGEWKSWAYRAAYNGHIGMRLSFLLNELLDSGEYMKAAGLVLEIAQLDSQRRDDDYEEPNSDYTGHHNDGTLTPENYVVDARIILAALLSGDGDIELHHRRDRKIPYKDWREFLNLSPDRNAGYFWLFLAEKYIDSRSGNAEFIRKKINETNLAKHDEIEKLVGQWKPKYLDSYGSGFFWRDYVITAQHVIDDCDEIRVSLHKVEKKDIVFESSESDLAALQIQEHERRDKGYLENSIPSYRNEIGKPVYTFGYPDNQEYWVSGWYYDFQTVSSAVFLYHTAPTNPGHSGGPVLDRFGRVIGVASKTFSVVNDRILQKVREEGKAVVVQGKFQASWIGNLFFFMDKDADYITSQSRLSVGDGTAPAPLDDTKIREKAKKYTVPITCWKDANQGVSAPR